MIVELSMYFKQYLLGMFKVSHLVEEVTARLLDMNSGPIFPFSSDFFFCLLLSQDFTDFFFLTSAVNIVSAHWIIVSPGREQAKHIGWFTLF